jgi:hypothetical protein
MRSGLLPKDDAWLAFYSTIWKSPTFPLPALNLTKEECKRIMLPVLQYLLTIGVCCNFPINLVYNAKQFMGLSIKHLHTTQEIARIKDILNHVHHRTTTGTLYFTSTEILILEVGMGVHLHTTPKVTLEILST